ncbi:MAG: trehalose-6-phosphate synthase [Bryobacteraceae bacterium]
MTWSKQELHDFVRERLRDFKLIVVSNREPYIHGYAGDRIECVQPASGMVAALDPIMQACGGVWVAHGSGDADMATTDANHCVDVPPENPLYKLRRVWLDKEQEAGYYYRLSNEGLWPLCHIVYRRPAFHPEDWQLYRDVNALFADAVIEEAGDSPTFVFIQDYHFGLLPRMLKDRNPNLVVAQFWHIPWPNREMFRAFPWQEELLDGMLANDLLGFHLRYHCRNFVETVDRSLECLVDHERHEITRRGKTTAVRAFPISIDFEEHSDKASGPEVAEEMVRWKRQLGLRGRVFGVGLDRIDYTKGIPDRLRSLDRFLETNPEFRERLVFLQVGVPSRIHIEEYRLLGEEIESLVEEINWKWLTRSWRPIVLLKQHLGPRAMMALHRLADFCMVTSLHDGMNLVAKEYVASRSDDDGVLILSRFTGAAGELEDAVLVNPFDREDCADAIRKALEMPAEERRRRMQKMRAVVAGNDVYRWAGKIVSSLLKFEFPQPMQPEREERILWIQSGASC